MKFLKKSMIQLSATIESDIRKLRHEPTELLIRMVQPILWLVIFGQAMAKFTTISINGNSYLDYIAPGILSQSILFIGIFYGISLIWERDMGILQKLLASPTPRFLLVLGRSIAAGIRGLSQIAILYLLSYFLGIHLRWEFFSVLGVIVIVMLGGAIFSTISLIVASLVKKRERFMGIGQVLTMPLFFASNALYPIDRMPHWLQILSVINPLTYIVDAIRYLMIANEVSHFGLFTDFLVSFLVLGALLIIATRVFPRILY